MMTAVDWWAVTVLIIAGVSLGLRGFMLKPGLAKWVSAPTAVWFWVLALAIVLGGAVWSILGGSHATGREAVVYTVLAICSSVLLVNLSRQSAETNDLRAALGHLDEGVRGLVHAAMEKVRQRRGLRP